MEIQRKDDINMEKRRKIFDDGATTVEEVSASKQKKKPELNVSVNYKNVIIKTVKVEDVLSAFAGYLPTQVNFMPRDDSGECVICGNKTSSSMRAICFDCIQRRGQELYLKAKKSIENGDTEFQI